MTPTPLGAALAQAVEALRADLGDPLAPVAVLTPSAANGQLARQSLARHSGFIRVDFVTPERLAQGLGAARLAAQGLRPEPAGWLRSLRRIRPGPGHPTAMVKSVLDFIAAPSYA